MIDVWGVDRSDLFVSKGFADGLGRLGRKAGKKAVQRAAQSAVPKAVESAAPKAIRKLPENINWARQGKLRISGRLPSNHPSPRAPMSMAAGSHTVADTPQSFGRSVHEASPYRSKTSFGAGPGHNMAYTSAPEARPHRLTIGYEARGNIPGHTAPPRSGGPKYTVRRSDD